MEEVRKQKVLSLISNRILQTALNSNASPFERLRFIEVLLEIYADAMVKDHILETLKRCKTNGT